MTYKIFDINDSLFADYPQYEAINARDAVNQHIKTRKYTFSVIRGNGYNGIFKVFAPNKKSIWFVKK